MAWITKNSAAMKVDKRADPYMTAALKEKFTKEILPRYETKLAALLPCLHAVQHENGWIPGQAMLEIAEFLGVTPAEVIDTASFYEEYWLKPKGRHLIQVCRSIACEVCGQEGVTEAVKAKLGIEVGETTDDGEFTLIELECLGACDCAPVALIDEALYENLTAANVGKAIDDVRKGAAHKH